MGLNHAKAIQAQAALHPDVKLSAVSDRDYNALIKAREILPPDTPLYWVPDDDSVITPDNLEAFKIERIASHAAIIEKHQITALTNAVHNDGHVSVLEDALTIRAADGTPSIHTIWQEKPYGRINENHNAVNRIIADHHIVFSLNSILLYSPVWHAIDDCLSSSPQMQLTSVKCTYGKDRTQDTRPAFDGWVGMEGIHAVDLIHSTLDELEFTHAEHIYGFLAENASDDGHVAFAVKAEGTGKRNGQNVNVDLKGSFAWAQQYRRLVLHFSDASCQEQKIQIDFDMGKRGNLYDRLQVWRNGACIKSEEFRPQEITIDGIKYVKDKLFEYYNAVISGQTPRCDLERTISSQTQLARLLKPDVIHKTDAKHAPSQP